MPELDPLQTPLRGRFLLEASAGTGKTYTLVLLFLRLLLEEKLRIDQILVLTFTRAATAELQDRIRKRLREALDHLERRGKGKDALLTTLLDRLPNQEEARGQLNQAITHMDEATIYTIHSFCQHTLADYALKSGTDFNLIVLPDEKKLRQEIIEDFWRAHFYGGDEHSQEQALHAAAFWQNPTKLLASLGPVAVSMEMLVWPIVAPKALAGLDMESRESFFSIQALWLKSRTEIESILLHNKWLGQSEKAYRPDQVKQMLHHMDALTAAEKRPVGPLAKIMERFSAATMETLLLKKKCNDSPPQTHPFFQQFGQFFAQHNNFLTLARLQLLHQARIYLQDEAHRRKEAGQELSYDDMLCRLDTALTHPEHGPQLATSLAKQFPALLIDEFQDTDPMQYRILSTIAKHGGRSLFLIGDPKQAIYSFRGADIFTYIQARRETPPKQLLSMGVNYRSSQAMVAAVNRVLGNRADAFIFSKDIPFQPVTAADQRSCGLELDGQLLHPLQVLLLTEEKAESKAISKGGARSEAAQLCAEAIRFLLDASQQGTATVEGHPVAATDIAILTRSHSEARLMEQALAKLGLVAIICEQRSVFASPEAKQVARVLEALADPTNRRLVHSALATALFGLSAQDLYALRDKEAAWDQWLQRFLHYQNLWQEQGTLALLLRLFAEHGLVPRLSSHIGGERSLTNYLHLAELLQQSPASQHGLAGQCRWLRLQIQEPDHDATDQLIRLESEANLIRILTIHRAKGLEFSLVFLPFAWNEKNIKGTAAGKPLLFHERKDLRQILYLGAIGLQDQQMEEGEKLAAEESLAEELRLFYVGITRAKHCCFFACGRISGLPQSPLGYLLHRGEEVKDDAALCHDLEALNRGVPPVLAYWPQRAEIGAVSASDQKDEIGQLHVQNFSGQVGQGWLITSYSRLIIGAERDEESGKERLFSQIKERAEPNFVDIFTFPQGPEAGTCLHHILERLDFRRPLAQQQAVITESLQAAIIDTTWSEGLGHWLEERVLATPLPGACCLRDLTWQNRIDEFAFLFSLQQMDIHRFNAILKETGYRPLPMASGQLSGLMKGFIDLLFRFQDRYYLADYKSNHLGMSLADYGPDQLEAAMVEHHYHLQALIYSLALRRFLRLRLGVDGEGWRQHFGGIFYLFLRGMDPTQPGNGIYTMQPDEHLLARLDACCGGQS